MELPFFDIDLIDKVGIAKVHSHKKYMSIVDNKKINIFFSGLVGQVGHQ